MRRGAMAVTVSVALAVGGGFDGARAQSWTGWNAYWENDSFVLIGGSDDAFTNGVRLAVGRHPSASESWMDFLSNWLEGHAVFGRNRSEGSDSNWSLVVGQNFFTPREITTYTVDPTDRPYAGLWYAGLRADLTERPVEEEVAEDELVPGGPLTRPRPFQSLRQHSLELDVGILGQGSGANPVQSSVHAAFSTHRLPKGWPHQIRNWPAVTVLYMVRQRIGNRYFDVVPHGGVLAGTVQTYPFAGAAVRAGWNLTGFPALIGRQTAAAVDARPDWEAGVMAGLEGRYFINNVFVEGRWFDGDDDPGVDPVRPVGDYRLGFWVRLQDWRFDYTFVRRSPEVNEVGPSERLYDNYGSVSIAYEPGPAAAPGTFVDRLINGVLGRVLDDFILEVGLGPDLLDEDGDDVVQSHGLHVAVGRALPVPVGDFDVTYELIGVGHEGGPATEPGGDHFDRFLVNNLFTLRYRPLGGRIGPGVFHVRAGIGRSHVEVEATPDAPGPRQMPCPPVLLPTGTRYCTGVENGTGYLLGGGYSLDFGHDLGFNTDLAWNQVAADNRERFLALTFGIRWAPR